MSEDVPLTSAQIDTALAQLPGWQLRDGWIRKSYATPGWPHTLMLANTIAYVSEAAYHHPDLVLGYAQLTVKLQTHKVHSITQLDIDLARQIDAVVLWKPSAESSLPGYPKKWVKADA